MRTTIAVTFLMLSLVLTGCATQYEPMSREESLATTMRTYEGVTEEEFYEAAKRLFRLLDEDDVTISYPNEHSMLAEHFYNVYLVFAVDQGTYVWKIQTEPTENGLKASVAVANNAGGVVGTPTGGGGAQVTSMPAMQNTINTPAVYEMFWGRMDNLLGKSEEWPTCEEYNQRVEQGQTRGRLDPLCRVHNVNAAPEA